MKTAVVIARLFLGAWMLFNGLNYFFRFVPQPMGLKSHYLHVAFMQSGLFALAKVTEVALGLSLLSNRFVPLLLVASFPVSVNVAWLALLIEDPRFWGTVIFLVHIFLLAAYLPYYAPMLVFRSRPIGRGDPDAVSDTLRRGISDPTPAIRSV